MRLEDTKNLAYMPTPPVGEVLDLTPPAPWDEELDPGEQERIDLIAKWGPAAGGLIDPAMPTSLKDLFGIIARAFMEVSNSPSVRQFQRMLVTSGRQSGRAAYADLFKICTDNQKFHEGEQRKQGTHLVKSAKPGIMLPERQRCSGPQQPPFRHRGSKR